LTETDLGRDLHQRSSKIEDTDKSTATFADMARAGLGGLPFRPDHMASHEPISLHNYVKFKKPKNRKGAYSPMVEDPNAQAGAGAAFTTAQTVIHDPPGERGKWMIKVEQSLTSLSVAATITANTPSFMPAPHPVDALGQHFAQVRQTFGRDLPPAAHLQGTEGQHDGEVQFTIDGGGDILAHSWSVSQYQWSKVGLFSYRRQAIEGSLGVRQLKGQKIGSAFPRNQIEHFRALAKQFEEENLIITLSPTALDTSATHARQPPPSAAVPLVSPLPKRPGATLGLKNDFNGSMSTVYNSQQTGLPMLDTLAANGNATAQPGLKRCMTNMSDNPLAINATSASLYKSHDSSPIDARDTSPFTRRYVPPTTETGRINPYNQFGYAPSISQASTTDDKSSADMAKERQVRIWQEEQARMQQQRPNVEAPREPIFGNAVPAATLKPSMFSQYQTPYTVMNMKGPGESSRMWPSNGNQGYATAGAQRDDASTRPAMTIIAPKNEFSWSTLASGRDEGTRNPFINSNFGAADRNTDLSTIAKPATTEPKEAYASITSIGHSQADDSWHNRKAHIWSKPKQHSALHESLLSDPSTPSPIGTRSTLEDEMQKQAEEMARIGLRFNGPFFTAGEGSADHFDLDVESQVDQLFEDLEKVEDAHTEFLRDKAERLRDSNGNPVSESQVEEMVHDPVSRMMWAVKLNLKAYKDTPPEQGDYFQRQWSKPDPKLIDRSEKGAQSFFVGSCPSSDEILFKGRGAARSEASKARVDMADIFGMGYKGVDEGMKIFGQS
jgi:hypothetical protein